MLKILEKIKEVYTCPMSKDLDLGFLLGYIQAAHENGNIDSYTHELLKDLIYYIFQIPTT